MMLLFKWFAMHFSPSVMKHTPVSTSYSCSNKKNILNEAGICLKVFFMHMTEKIRNHITNTLNQCGFLNNYIYQNMFKSDYVLCVCEN